MKRRASKAPQKPKKKKRAKSTKTKPKKGTSPCQVEDCNKRVHGVFTVCKLHLRPVGMPAGTLYKWRPGTVGLQTLKSIPELTRLYDLSGVRVEHVANGNKSKIPVSCRLCNHVWFPSIRSLVSKGSGCAGCSGTAGVDYGAVHVSVHRAGNRQKGRPQHGYRSTHPAVHKPCSITVQEM